MYILCRSAKKAPRHATIEFVRECNKNRLYKKISRDLFLFLNQIHQKRPFRQTTDDKPGKIAANAARAHFRALRNVI